MGTSGLQAKVDYRADLAPKALPPVPLTVTSLLPLLTRALLGDEEAKAECLRLLSNVPSQEQDTQKPPTIEYSSKEVESTWTHLKVFAQHSREYMVEHGKWEVCKHTPSQTVLPSQLLSDPQSKELLGVLATKPMADLFAPFCNDLMT